MLFDLKITVTDGADLGLYAAIDTARESRYRHCVLYIFLRNHSCPWRFRGQAAAKSHCVLFCNAGCNEQVSFSRKKQKPL